VAASEGLSFADLSGLLREAALQALRRDSRAMSVTPADVEFALERYAGGAVTVAGSPPSDG
jgi:hypothetical protein